ncbi:hypothetical protein M1614_01175 [Candidatus Marsarchaeota archaeon]|nr:hypothetical protein [Candidatus Marsarchaeota archaeon]
METKKIIRNTLIGASVLIVAATASGCGQGQETAKNIGTTIPEIKKVERNPYVASCNALAKSALYEMRRGEINSISYLAEIHNLKDELVANNLLKIYSLRKCNTTWYRWHNKEYLLKHKRQ